MSTLTKWNPLREMNIIENRLASMFGRPFLRGNGEETIQLADWAPLVDVMEDDKEFMIQAELPDVRKEDVKVTVEEGALRISGERKFEKEEKGRKYHRIERSYGSFERSFTLPEGAQGDKVSADYKDGVLKVHVPKSEVIRPKAIEVKVA